MDKNRVENIVADQLDGHIIGLCQHPVEDDEALVLCECHGRPVEQLYAIAVINVEAETASVLEYEVSEYQAIRMFGAKLVNIV